MFDISLLKQIRNVRHDTDKLIVAYYPQMSGGKFILNCLGLSRHMVLQDADLAKQQLSGNLKPIQKLRLLLDRLDQTEARLTSGPCADAWQDLRLGCAYLFGDDAFRRPQVAGFDLRHCKFNPVINHLTHSDLYFACVAHDIMTLHYILERWPCARVIRLVNGHNFQTYFRPNFSLNHHQVNWQRLRGPDWPLNHPTNLDQYQSMSSMVHQELCTLGAWDYFASPLLWAKDQDWLLKQEEHHYQSVTAGHDSCIWDVDNYTVDHDMMLCHLEKLYLWLGLDDFDPVLCSQFHTQYIKILNLVRQHNETATSGVS